MFATDRATGIHPQHGIPQLYFDQMNIIAKHLQDIRQETTEPKIHLTQCSETKSNQPDEPTSQTFKLHQLKKRDEWAEWQQSRYKMLDQYLEQGIISEPIPLPENATAFRMLWTYVLKIFGTRKSRMVCDGNMKRTKHMILGYTYANSLNTAGERLFWALVANENLITIGADVSNAFAKAPPPKESLYMYIDEAFREW
jgi:hypothetical protein